jgi:hypothetical protein
MPNALPCDSWQPSLVHRVLGWRKIPHQTVPVTKIQRNPRCSNRLHRHHRQLRLPPILLPATHKLSAPPQLYQLNTRRQLPDMFLKAPASDLFSPFFASTIMDPDTGKSMEYQQLITNEKTKTVRQQSAANKFGRLVQGLPKQGIIGTDTIQFIPRSKIPSGHSVTYAHFVCEECPPENRICAHLFSC